MRAGAVAAPILPQVCLPCLLTSLPPCLAALQKRCSPLSLPSLKVLSSSGPWSRFAVHLGDFGGRWGGTAAPAGPAQMRCSGRWRGCCLGMAQPAGIVLLLLLPRPQY